MRAQLRLNDSTVFQQVDIDGSYDNLQAGPQFHVFGVTQVRLVPLVPSSSLICFCVKEGHSVLVHVTGFMPYFYIAMPRGFESADIASFISDLNVRRGRLVLLNVHVLSSSQSSVNAVTSIELVKKRNLWGYKGDDFTPFMKITVTDPKAVPRVRDE